MFFFWAGSSLPQGLKFQSVQDFKKRSILYRFVHKVKFDLKNDRFDTSYHNSNYLCTKICVIHLGTLELTLFLKNNIVVKGIEKILYNS